MRDFGSQTAIGLRDRTDDLSPIGNISWKQNTLDPPLAFEGKFFESEESGDPVHTDVAERSEGSWFISFSSFVDLDSSSLRVAHVDTSLISVISKVFEGVPVGSRTTSKFSFTDFLTNRKSRQIDEDVANLFSLATFIDLEPGMTNEFQEGLEETIEMHGQPALDAVEGLILNEETKSSIAMEALQYIGYTDSTKWHDERRRTLERCLLKSPSAWVRDGAGLGLASLDDPKSIPALERAILAETSLALKEDLTLVLNQLLDTQREQ